MEPVPRPSLLSINLLCRFSSSTRLAAVARTRLGHPFLTHTVQTLEIEHSRNRSVPFARRYVIYKIPVADCTNAVEQGLALF
jgi:hypothetical protein